MANNQDQQDYQDYQDYLAYQKLSQPSDHPLADKFNHAVGVPDNYQAPKTLDEAKSQMLDPNDPINQVTAEKSRQSVGGAVGGLLGSKAAPLVGKGMQATAEELEQMPKGFIERLAYALKKAGGKLNKNPPDESPSGFLKVKYHETN
jgi:hypothetical protein